MRFSPFKLERYFARYEFSARYNLAASDCEALSQAEVLDMADDDMRRLWDELRLGYTESQGAPFLRDEIAALYQAMKSDDILVCTPVEGIFVAMNAVLERGDHVISTFPEYQALYEVAQALECDVERWPADEKQGWRFDPLWLEDHVRPDTKLIVTNFPHNPTGWLPEDSDFKRIIDIAAGVNAYLFSDEMYRFTEQDSRARLPAACDVYQRAVSLDGMSKAFGMPGVRIGWLGTQDPELMECLHTVKDYTSICSNAPGEILATIALRSKKRILERNMGIIEKNLERLDIFCEKHPTLFYWNRPTAGTVAFPRLLIDRDSREFCEELVGEAGVLMLPGSVFDYGGEHVRIGYGRENLDEGLLALEKYVVTNGL
ncbi:MAG: aminotransferase class I/II-fold pyridoxal phosphate-dependent enzyme [Candidatus Geothermincolia bacterium]